MQIDAAAIYLLVRASIAIDNQAELSTTEAEMTARALAAEAQLRAAEEKFHELRAAIAGVRMAAEIVHDRLDIPPDTRIRLQNSQYAELQRLQRLLADKGESPIVPFSVRAALEPVIDSAVAEGLTLNCSGLHEQARGRPDEVAEIVQCLLSNAARHAPNTKVTLRASRSGGLVNIRVHDGGRGVDPNVERRLFVRGSHGAASPGSGLGLHIAARLARGMHGSLRLDESGPSTGACFHLTLPALATSRGDQTCLAHSA